MGELVDRDQEHLRQLTLAYYGMAGFIGFFSLFGIIYFALGGMMMSGAFPPSDNPREDPQVLGVIFMVTGAIVVGAGLVIALLTYLAGRGIRDRRRRTYCLIVAGLSCLHIPWGTALGVCTFMVLNRPSVRSLFEPSAAPPPLDPEALPGQSATPPSGS